MIRIVPVAALHQASLTGPVVARSQRVLDDSSLAGQPIEVVHTYDDLLTDIKTESVDEMVLDLTERGMTTDITFLVPALPGDAIAAKLDSEILASVSTGAPDRAGFGLGQCHVVDALEIATAELQAPFDRGYLALEPRVPLVVTNWYGTSVTELSMRRLGRLYGVDGPVGAVRGLELLVPPVKCLEPVASMTALEHIVARLRRPDGCPWDREQTTESLLPQFLEEVDEFAEAVGNGDVANQCEELGDVLFHIVAQCQLASESGRFSLDDVLREVTAKLVRRHPHVFGDVEATTYDEVLATWNRVKAEEKSATTNPG